MSVFSNRIYLKNMYREKSSLGVIILYNIWKIPKSKKRKNPYCSFNYLRVDNLQMS